MSEVGQVSKKCLEAIVNHMPDPMFIIDINGIIVSWNKAMENLLMIPSEKVIGKTKEELSVIFYDEERPIIADLVLKPNAEIESRYEKFKRNDDRSVEGFTWSPKWNLYIWAKASPFYDLDGEMIGIMEINRNITEIREQEIKYRELCTRQEALMKAIPDIVMETDTNKVYVWANHAGYDFFGEDVIGKEASYYFKEGNEKTYEIVDKIFKGDESVVYVESKQKRKDGETRLLSWWSKVVKDTKGKVEGAISSARDMTDHIELEQRLFENQQKYKVLFGAMKTILDNVNLMIWAKDIDNKYTFINKQYRDFLGLRSRDILGKKFQDFVQMDKDYSAENTDEIAKKQQYIDTVPITYKEKKYWLSICKTPLTDENGVLIGTVGTAKDVTENILKKEDIELQSIKLREEIEKGIMAWKTETELASIEVSRTIEEIRKSIHNVTERVSGNKDYWGKIL